jgi:hypothetical protein
MQHSYTDYRERERERERQDAAGMGKRLEINIPIWEENT